MWKSRIVSEGTEAQDQLLANPCNPRIHPQTQQKALQASLANIGWVQRILVNKNTGHVVDGHARIELAISNGETEVPVTYLDLTEQEEKLILATYDPISAMAVNDQDMLNDLIKDIDTDSAALQELLDDLATEAPVVGQTDEDSVPEVKEDPKSERGKIYLLGRHRVMCGDSVSDGDVSRLLNGCKPVLMVTDPPYGVNYDPNWRNEAAEKGHMSKANRAVGNVSNDDNADWTEAYRLFDAQVAYVWHDGKMAAEVQSSLELADFCVISQIIWAKPMHAISRGDYHWQHEPCWYAHKNGETHNWQGSRSETTLWKIERGCGEKTGHGTEKPLDCMGKPIENNTAKGDLVADPFLGSGTTLIAAEKLGRTCYGMEIDPHYVDVIRKRWAEFVHGEGCDWEELTPAEQPNG